VEDTFRRGESYHVWCMDRPTQFSGLRPVALTDGGAFPSKLPAAWERFPEAAKGEPILIAMMAGDAGEWVEKSSDSDVVEAVVDSLKSLFGPRAVPAPVSHKVTRWRSDVYARGSYSNIPVGSHGMHYDIMAAPVGEGVFWAGEATNRHHPTTAAGAFDSGQREAHRVARLWGRSRDSAVAYILEARAARLALQPVPAPQG